MSELLGAERNHCQKRESLEEAVGNSHVRQGVDSEVEPTSLKRRRCDRRGSECRSFGPLLGGRWLLVRPLTDAAISFRPFGPEPLMDWR
jgi:hypothetical protein